MNKPRIYTLFASFLLLSTLSWGQFYNTGAAPYKVKWRMINTQNFKLIYPAETEKLAQKYASTIDQLYSLTSYTLNHNPDKIDIIMYNQSVLSNAYVVWAPKRMELVTTPPQRQYAHDWMEQLALHEYRHVTQVDKLNQGFTKGLSYVTGEMGVGAMMAFLPLWYLEGDAVVTETALTNSGRGRDPGFVQEVMAAELQQEKRFSYDEFYLGSYKHYVPNHYHYGYHMVAWSRQKFGAEFWPKVIDHVGRRPFTFAPFYFKLKSETGLSKVSLYNKTMDDLSAQWANENEKIEVDKAKNTGIESSYASNFVSYRFPYRTADSTILALRTSIDDIARIIELEASGKEKTLCKLGLFQGSKVSYSKELIAWEEVQSNTRWERKNTSVIRIYNRKTNKSSVLKHKSRHFAPDIRSGSEELCLVRNDELYNSYIEVYNISTKEKVKEIKAPYGGQFSFPVWIDSRHIAVVVTDQRGKSIQVLDLQLNEWKTICGPGFENINNLEARGNYVYFSYGFEGRQNIYAVNLTSNKLFQVTNEAIGANYASASQFGDELLYGEYTSEGYKVVSTVLQTNQFKEVDTESHYNYSLATSAASQEKINIQDSLLHLKEYESKSYSKWLHSFNIHSWLIPFYVPLDEIPDQNTQVYPGITLLSQNSLSTVTSTLSYYYRDGYHHIRPTLSFRMLYPVLKFDYLIGGPVQLYAPSYYSDSLATFSNYQEYNTELSVPLNFSTSRYNFRIVPALKHRYSNVYVADTNYYDTPDFSTNQFNYYQGVSELVMRLSANVGTKLSYKSLRPRWAFQYYMSYQQPLKHKQYWNENSVQLLTANTPGLFRHHSLQIQLRNEWMRGANTELPRGYSRNNYYEVFQTRPDETYKIGTDYALPLFYPNWSLGPVMYIKRFQAKVFYDYMIFKNTNIDALSSVGGELGMEVNFLRFFATFVPTLQYSYLIESGNTNIGFFLSTQYGFSLGNH